jgi:rubredoxin
MTAKSNCDPITLHQCEWVYDGLTGEKLVRVNGTTYRYARLPGRV